MSKATQARIHWIEVISRQRASGQGVAEFCRREAVAASSFYAWRRRLGEAQAPVDSGGSAFVEITTTAREPGTVGDGGGSGVEVHLGNGRRIGGGRCFDPPTLRRVLAVLEKMPAAGEEGVVA
jgi:hypothetical protein